MELKATLKKNRRAIVILVVGLVAIGGVSTIKKKKSDVVAVGVRLTSSLLPKEKMRELSLELGAKFLRAKEYAAAKRVFEEILALEPTNVSILNNLAFAIGEMGDKGRAKEYLLSALQIDARCAECSNNLGTLLMNEGKTSEAKEAFEKAASLDVTLSDPRLSLGVLAEDKSDWTGAYEWYRQAEPLIQDPELKKWVMMRANWMAEISQAARRQVAGEKNK